MPTTPVNTIKQRPLEPIMAELAAAGFNPSGPFAIAVRDMLTRADKTATNNGEIQSKANFLGRTEPIATTVGHIDSAGTALAPMVDFSRAYANKDTDHITDGTGTPLAGGKRGAIALNSNNQLANTFKGNPTNTINVSASSITLTNDGISTAIVVASSSVQFGAGLLSYNAGSVDPGVFGTFYIYASDPQFLGGAVTYLFATVPQTTTAGDGLIYFGKILTVNGSSKSGGGNTGGSTPGGTGGSRGA